MSDGNIGVITDEQSKDERIETFKKVAENLEKIEGVDHAQLDDWTRTADSGVIFVFLENDGLIRDGLMPDRSKTYDITANLRSVSPRLKNCLEDKDKVTDFKVMSKPKKKYSDVTGKGVGYDQDFYEIDVWTY